jgi:hypothetical protein
MMMLGLRVRHISLEQQLITLNPGETKNGQGRNLRMTSKVFELISELIRGKAPEDYVFTRERTRAGHKSRNGGRMGRAIARNTAEGGCSINVALVPYKLPELSCTKAIQDFLLTGSSDLKYRAAVDAIVENAARGSSAIEQTRGRNSASQAIAAIPFGISRLDLVTYLGVIAGGVLAWRPAYVDLPSMGQISLVVGRIGTDKFSCCI